MDVEEFVRRLPLSVPVTWTFQHVIFNVGTSFGKIGQEEELLLN